MPVPAHTLMTWKGVFGSALTPIEEWQFSLKGSGIGVGVTSSERQLLADAMRDAYQVSMPSVFPPSVILTECEIAEITDAGLYEKSTDGAYRRSITTATVPGTGTAGPTMPLQTALCVSLVTGRDGPTGKGRFYLPWVRFPLGADGRLPVSETNTMALTAAAFVGDVKAIIGEVVVASSKGYTSPVTGVRVGRVPDTQRRRRGDLIEAYAEAPLS